MDAASPDASNDPRIEARPLRGVIAIGASAGGVAALQALARDLDPAIGAAILVVQHIGSHRSILPELLEAAGALPAAHARDGEALEAGRIYVAPPDRHLLVQDGALRLFHGAKEHHTRPAIDPLFRSLAIAWGARAVGVVLTGWGEDGTAGLQAIRACGGTPLAQHPADAEMPDMPLSAVMYAGVERLVALESLARELERAVAAAGTRASPTAPPHWLVHEQQSFLLQGNPMEHLNAIATPSTFVCPDCQGGLWEVRDAKPRRFRCHTGHAFALRTLQEAQSEATDAALWSAMRGLEEKEMLLRATASQCLEEGNAEEAARLQVLAHSVAGRAAMLRGLIEREAAANDPGEPRAAQAD